VLRAQFEVNVFGWHDLTRRVIPAMRARGEGRIVFCSSVLGLIAIARRLVPMARKKREMPVKISGDDARAGVSAHRMIYVLWVGLAGAILALALVLFFR
jgi:NAD(P)-dependent dehydrogenase (short-subunit alcohol dehydrogenase family)